MESSSVILLYRKTLTQRVAVFGEKVKKVKTVADTLSIPLKIEQSQIDCYLTTHNSMV